MKSEKLQEEMFRLCHEYETSGKKREVFCREKDISLSRFAYWRSRYLAKEKQDEEGFVPITPQVESGIDIYFPNGVRISLPPGSPVSDLKTLIGLV